MNLVLHYLKNKLFSIIIIVQFIIFMVNCAFLNQNLKNDVIEHKVEKTACSTSCSYLETLKDEDNENGCKKIRDLNVDCTSWCENQIDLNSECWIGITSCNDLDLICHSFDHLDGGKD